MPVQDFLPFATGLGSNVEGQAAYITDAMRTAGNQRGIASSSLNNKAIRQGTFCTAAISQFIADVLNEDVLDNGDLARYEDQFQRAIRTYMFRYVRQKLTANTDYYVDVNSGSDLSSGALGSPWKTLQKAWNFIQQSIDLAGFSVTVHVADGVYAASGSVLNASGAIIGQSMGAGSLLFIGNAGTPANCVISSVSDNCVNLNNGAALTLNGFKLTTGGLNPLGFCIAALAASSLSFQNLEFGSCGNIHLNSSTGSQIFQTGNYRISGGASNGHVRAHGLGLVTMNFFSTTITAPITFGSFYAEADDGGVLESVGQSFTGSAVTGKRYSVFTGGQINTQSGGPNYFPGSIAGTSDRVDQYA